jgi:hypothetical protein
MGNACMQGEVMVNFADRERPELRYLAEAIILQALEDLWNIHHRKESIEFFSGEEFRSYSEIAGMDHFGKLRLLWLIDSISKRSGIVRFPGCPYDKAGVTGSLCP